MSARKESKRAWGALGAMLAILLLLAAGIFASSTQGGAWAPKLALDLSGGTQLILAPQANSSQGQDQQLSDEELEQAVEIIRQRVDGSGVAEAEISTQSGQNVVVSVPGTLSPETRQLIQTSAQMSFRAVINAGTPAALTAEQGACPSPLPNPQTAPILTG